jgi:CheY-like chemotaxis protein
MVADILRAEIQEGRYQPGERLPGQHELAKDFNVAFTTLKNALDILAREGYVVRKAGQGTYAALPVRSKPAALVVDDDENVREYFTRLLSSMDWKGVPVASGRLALEELRRKRFDLVFLDLAMPGMNGPDTFREIRKIDPDMYVVIITAYAESDLMQQALEIGPFAVMLKPVDLDDLRHLVGSVTRRSPTSAGTVT